MSQLTTNYGFTKPELTDVPDITVLSQNWEMIDSILKSIDMRNKITIVDDSTDANSYAARGIYFLNNANNVPSEGKSGLLFVEPWSDSLATLQFWVERTTHEIYLRVKDYSWGSWSQISTHAYFEEFSEELSNTVQSTLSTFSNSIQDNYDYINTVATALREQIGNTLVTDTISSSLDTSKAYVYVGTSTSTIDKGDWIYYDGTEWKSGGVYNSEGYQTDNTLTVSDMAADAKVVGDEIAELKRTLNIVEENTYDYTEKPVTAVATGWKLKDINDGKSEQISGWQILKYVVTAGDVIRVVSDHRFQFQNASNVPETGTINRVGKTYEVYDGLITVPQGATYVVLSTLISGGIAKAYYVYSNETRLENIKKSINNEYKVVDWINGKQVDSSNGTLTDNSSWVYTDYIPIDYAAYPVFTIHVLSDYGSTHNAFYDSNKEFISAFSFSSGYSSPNVYVPTNAAYFRLSISNAQKTNVYLGNDFVRINRAKVDDALRRIEDLEYIVTIKPNVRIFDNEYINHSGVRVKNDGWKRTDYIRCDGLGKIKIINGNTNSWNAFYDSDKNFLGYFTVGVQDGGYVVTIPNNAKYFILSNLNAYLSDEVNGITTLLPTFNIQKRIDDLDNSAMNTKMVSGYTLNGSTGEMTESANYSCSDYVPFNGGFLTVTNTSDQGTTGCCFYDEAKTFLRGFSIFPNTEHAEVPAPSDARFFRWSIGTGVARNVSFNIRSKDWFYTSDILALNGKESVGQYIIQSRRAIFPYDGSFQENSLVTFSVLTDIHAFGDEFRRYMRFTDYYSDYVTDKICLGDIVRDNISQDFDWWKNHPDAKDILIALGNHDACSVENNAYQLQSSSTCYDKYFADLITYWNVIQPTGGAENGLCYYYKDYTVSNYTQNVRLIVLDCMHYTADQHTWFTNLLSDAKTNNLSVVCATHYPVPGSKTKLDGNFYNNDRPAITEWGQSVPGIENNNARYETVINAVDDFISNGGEFIAWLTGHMHSDNFSEITVNGRKQLLLNFENAGCHDSHKDGSRVTGTKSQDSFNFITIDTRSKLIKIIRIGNNMNRFMKPKNFLCYNYNTHTVVSYG